MKQNSAWLNLAVGIALIFPYALHLIRPDKPTSASRVPAHARRAAPASPITQAPEDLPGEDDADAAVYQARILVPQDGEASMPDGTEAQSHQAQNELSAMAFKKTFAAPEMTGSGAVASATTPAEQMRRANEETATWEAAIQVKSASPETPPAAAAKRELGSGNQSLRGGNGLSGGIGNPFKSKGFASDSKSRRISSPTSPSLLTSLDSSKH